MPTVITSSIGTNGRDYSTIGGWEADTEGNLVQEDRVEVGECFNDSTFELAAQFEINGGTTDATRYRHLTAAEGHRHLGDPNAGVLLDFEMGDTAALRINDTGGGSRVSWLRVQATSSNQTLQAVRVDNSSRAMHLLVGPVTSTAPNTTGALTGVRVGAGQVEACAVFGLAVANESPNWNERAIWVLSGAVALNCSVHCDEGQRGIDVSGTAKNCYSGGDGTAFDWGGPDAASHNASSDATANEEGTDNLINLTHADQVQDPANGDFRSKVGADIIGAGTDLSADSFATVGISGTERGATWDIGADQFPPPNVRVTATAYSHPDSEPGQRIWRVYPDGEGEPVQSSGWITPEATRDFLLLEDGDYEFTVQDRTVDGEVESDESARVKFTVGEEPPGFAATATDANPAQADGAAATLTPAGPDASVTDANPAQADQAAADHVAPAFAATASDANPAQVDTAAGTHAAPVHAAAVTEANAAQADAAAATLAPAGQDASVTDANPAQADTAASTHAAPEPGEPVEADGPMPFTLPYAFGAAVETEQGQVASVTDQNPTQEDEATAAHGTPVFEVAGTDANTAQADSATASVILAGANADVADANPAQLDAAAASLALVHTAVVQDANPGQVDASAAAHVAPEFAAAANDANPAQVDDAAATWSEAPLTPPEELVAVGVGTTRVDLTWTNTRPDLPTRIYRRRIE